MANWERMWKNGITKGLFFDAAQVEPALRKLIETNVLPKGRALVPGCGRGYAVEALALSNEREVIGVEISPTAVAVATDFLGNECGLPTDRARCIEGDFFGDSLVGDVGVFDVVYDCTFLCAIQPAQREAWAARMAELTKKGGELVLDIFPIGHHTTGPPFAMSEELVARLLEPAGFECIMMEPVPPADYARPKAMSAKESIARWRRK